MSSEASETKRVHLERWFTKRRGKRDAADEAAALAAADAFDAMKSQGAPSNAQLNVILAAAANPHELVFSTAVSLLNEAVQEWPDVADAVASLMKSNSPVARFSAMCCVRKHIPANLALKMVEMGLVDPNGKVRWKAGEMAHARKFSSLIPNLKRAIEIEKSGKYAKSLEHSLRMLCDGYVLRPLPNGSYSLWVEAANGGVGVILSEAELSAKGIERSVAELRQSKGAGVESDRHL